MYDLRSETEIEKYETPCPHIEGVDVVRTPVFSLEDYSPEMMAKYGTNYCCLLYLIIYFSDDLSSTLVARQRYLHTTIRPLVAYTS